MRHPEFYYGRAEEARSLAQATIDPETRKILIQRAAEYEDLARQATVQNKLQSTVVTI
jgi:hypothetical protein